MAVYKFAVDPDLAPIDRPLEMDLDAFAPPGFWDGEVGAVKPNPFCIRVIDVPNARDANRTRAILGPLPAISSIPYTFVLRIESDLPTLR